MPTPYEILGIKPPEDEGGPQLSPGAQEWMRTNEAARQGQMPSGEPISEALVREGRKTAGDVVRYGSAAVQVPSVAIPGVGPALSGAIGAGSETAAQLIESGEITSKPAIGAAAVIPPAVGGALKLGAKAVPAIAKRLPGAAVEMQKAGVAEARAIGPKYLPSVASDTLYSQVAKLNPRIPSNNMTRAANDLLLEELQNPGSLQGPLKKVAEDIIDVAKQNQGMVPFQQMRSMMKRVGQRTGVVQGQEANELRGGYKHLKAAIADDLDAAASTPVSPSAYGTSATRASGILKQANQAYRKEQAVGEIQDIIEGAVNKGRSDLLESFNPARALRAISENEFLQKSFSPKELGEIQAALRGLKGLPSLPAPGGEAPTGSGRMIARTLVGLSAGSGLGAASGNPVLAATLPGAGVIAANAAHSVISAAVTTDLGRRTLMKMLRANQGVLDERALRVLAQFTRGQVAGAPSPDVNDEAQ